VKPSHAEPHADVVTIPLNLAEVREPNELSDDFDVLGILGEGGGGRVFLARDRTLNRLVAVKVVNDEGAEATTLAQLEHDHIVRVFSETVEARHRVRLICMQYVPGATLGHIVIRLEERGREATGAAILQAIDALAEGQAPLDPALLAERGALERADAISATCRIGAALARALAHAHRRGIVHRDVKPNNILVTPYGRPMLVDFNIAASRSSLTPSPFGGTPRYAAPEQLLALAGRMPTESVDARADLYSLGAVLFELIAGHLPYDPVKRHEATVETRYAARLAPLRGLERSEQSARVLERVLHRSLEPDPARRYASAEELASALAACAALRECERELTPADFITRFAERRPIIAIAAAAVLPHAVCSAADVAFNAGFPAALLTPQQTCAFADASLAYNCVAFPLGISLTALLLFRLSRNVRQLKSAETSAAEATAARRRLVSAPLWGVAIGMLSWLPALVFIPWYVSSRAESPSSLTWAQFAVALLIGAVIASTYAALLVSSVVVRTIYPWASHDGRDLQARHSLPLMPARLRTLQVVASGGPPAAAVLVVALASEPLAPGLKTLLITLMGVGVLGFTAATYLASAATRAVQALERVAERTTLRS
jgi:hypothetical protein